MRIAALAIMIAFAATARAQDPTSPAPVTTPAAVTAQLPGQVPAEVPAEVPGATSPGAATETPAVASAAIPGVANAGQPMVPGAPRQVRYVNAQGETLICKTVSGGTGTRLKNRGKLICGTQTQWDDADSDINRLFDTMIRSNTPSYKG